VNDCATIDNASSDSEASADRIMQDYPRGKSKTSSAVQEKSSDFGWSTIRRLGDLRDLDSRTIQTLVREIAVPLVFNHLLTFFGTDSASSAVRNLNDYEIMGRKLRVDFSNEQKSGGDDDINQVGSAGIAQNNL
jgi:hypothetical protein